MASCGNSSKDKNGDLNDKKKELEKLKTEKNDIDAKVRKLETDINNMDSTALQTRKLVTVAPVTSQDFTHYIDLQGKIDAEKTAYVAPRNGGGQVKAVYVNEGQSVRRGQMLLKMDDAVARQQLVVAQQGIAGAESQAKLKRSIYERRQNLWKQNIGTEVEVMSAKTEAEAAEAQLSSARANVRLAEEAVSLTSVTAEMDGTVDKFDVRIGEFFNGTARDGKSAAIIIVNTSTLKVSIPVPESYLARIQKGKSLLVVLPELNKTVPTTISVVSKVIDPTTRSFNIEGKLPADKDLRPNQIASAKIEDYKSANAITVPINVVQTDEKGKYVYVAETTGGKTVARKKPVVVGESYGGMMEIKSGLQAGEQIITEGYQTVYDGQTITTAK
jgi:RND family efflux transporter MFP subunit